VGVREGHAGRGDAIEVGCGDFAVFIQTLEIAIAEIVAENIDDVGFFGGQRKDWKGKREQKTQKSRHLHSGVARVNRPLRMLPDNLT